MSGKRKRGMIGLAAGVLALGMMSGCSRMPEPKPEIGTSLPFYEPSGEEQTESEGDYLPSESAAESTEETEQIETSGMDASEETEQPETSEQTMTPEQTPENNNQTESSSEKTTGNETETQLTESEETDATEVPETVEDSTEVASVPETKESEAVEPTTAPVRPTIPESTENETESTTEEVTEEATMESVDAETEPAEEPTEAMPTEAPTETETAVWPTEAPETEAEITLSAVEIRANQSQYTEGWMLTKANLTVTVHYSDGTSGTLSTGYTIHQTGDQVYVTYEGVKSNTITVVYEKTLTSISIESRADRYEQGYQIISANLKVTLHYSDGSTEMITHGYTIHQSGASVYITYQGMKSNTITINYAAASRVQIVPRKDSYRLGDVVTLDDFTVTVYQSDGSGEVVSGDIKLLYKGEEVTSVTLTEYEEDIYVMGAHSFQVSYKGVVSEAVILNVRYEETGHLYREMLNYVTAARAEAGLPALVWDTEAEEEILIRAEELTRHYSHTRPDGEATTELYTMFWGENIANGGYYSKTHVQDVFDAWMNSAEHRSLILDSFAYATGFVCAYHIATDANGNQAAYTVMWVTMD